MLVNKKIAFITDSISPFWIEFANGVNLTQRYNFINLFCESHLFDRGNHWGNYKQKDSWIQAMLL